MRCMTLIGNTPPPYDSLLCSFSPLDSPGTFKILSISTPEVGFSSVFSNVTPPGLSLGCQPMLGTPSQLSLGGLSYLDLSFSTPSKVDIEIPNLGTIPYQGDSKQVGFMASEIGQESTSRKV